MEDFDGKDWGIRLNKKNYTKVEIPLPDWFEEDSSHSWNSEGLVVWDNDQKTIVNLNMWQALSILDRLDKDDSWKIDGLDLAQKYTSFVFTMNRKKLKKVSEELPPVQSREVTICLHMFPERVNEFHSFLKQNEDYVRMEGNIIRIRFESCLNDLVQIALNISLNTEKKKEATYKPDPYIFSI
jgi:hypothetical protein